jgi:hypothetical protein
MTTNLMFGNSLRKELDEVISNKREESYLTDGTLKKIQARKALTDIEQLELLTYRFYKTKPLLIVLTPIYTKNYNMKSYEK